MLYISTYTNSEMSTMSESDIRFIIGYDYKGDIIKPVRCRICGEYSFIDANLHIAQCPNCNNMSKVYSNDTLEFSKEWGVYGE